MKRNIESELKQMFSLTYENPGKLTIKSLADELNLGISTASKYVNEFRLPVKKATEYSKEQIDFVKNKAATMTKTDIAKALNLKIWQVDYIGKKENVSFYTKPVKQKTESEFFEHDKSLFY